MLNTDEIERDDVITRSFASLSEKKYMGSQYDWLARFSKDYKGIELCVHKDDKANEIIEAFGSSIEINDVNVGKFYKIDTEASCVDLLNVFGNYNFPLLKMTKLEMKKEAERKGFKDALYRSWFCHRPINNLPCGICNPCIYSIEEGMRDRFNMLSLSRYRVKKFAKFIRALVKGV